MDPETSNDNSSRAQEVVRNRLFNRPLKPPFKPPPPHRVKMLQYFSWKKIRGHKEAKEAAVSESVAGPDVAVNKPVTQVLEGPQPVISHHDEAILRKHLENVDEERVVILEGSSGATTPRPVAASTQAIGTLSTNAEAKDAEKGEWVAGFKSRLGGLRRTVSSAAQGRRAKPKSPGPSTEEKGKWKEEPIVEVKQKEKLKQKEMKSEGWSTLLCASPRERNGFADLNNYRTTSR